MRAALVRVGGSSLKRFRMEDPFKNVSELGRAEIARLQAEAAADPRILVYRQVAMTMLAIKETKLRKLISENQLVTLIDGNHRKIFVWSIYAYLIARVARTYPANGERALVHKFNGQVPKARAKGEGEKCW
jgi:hypothetical protein